MNIILHLLLGSSLMLIESTSKQLVDGQQACAIQVEKLIYIKRLLSKLAPEATAERQKLERLISYSYPNIDECRADHFASMADTLQAQSDQVIVEYLWHSIRNQLQLCTANDKPIAGFKLTKQSKRNARLLFVLCKTATGRTEHDRLALGSLAYIREQIGEKLLEGGKDEVKKLYEKFILPLCDLLGSKYSFAQYVAGINNAHQLETEINNWHHQVSLCTQLSSQSEGFVERIWQLADNKRN